jgi:hypothetical protein
MWRHLVVAAVPREDACSALKSEQPAWRDMGPGSPARRGDSSQLARVEGLRLALGRPWAARLLCDVSSVLKAERQGWAADAVTKTAAGVVFGAGGTYGWPD